MATVLRHIVASNRIKHQEAGLDLCYVTANLLATCVFSPLLFLLCLVFFLASFFFLVGFSSPTFRSLIFKGLPASLVTLLRRAAARPRVSHIETGLDLGYVTGGVIVTCVLL